MARPPGIIDRVNYIVDFIEDPCHAPWTVYVETALPALGQMVIQFVDVSPQDVLRFYVKPRGARSASRFGEEAEEADEEASGLIPDLNELVGVRLPGSDFFAESRVQDSLGGFWAIDGIFERVAWYFLLVDLITQGLYDWTSLINQTQYCEADLGGSAYATGDEFEQAVAHIWEPYPCPDIQKQWGTVSAGPQSTISFAEEGGIFVFGVNFVPVGTVSSVSIGYYTSTSSDIHVVKELSGPFDEGISHGILHKLHPAGAESYTAVVKFEISDPLPNSNVFYSGLFVQGFGHYPAYGPLPYE
jgi:hypothetical protein